MSSKLVSIGSRIEIPNDEVVIDLKITKSGKVQLAAPNVHPKDVCKLLNGVSLEVMFAAMELQEDKRSSLAK